MKPNGAEFEYKKERNEDLLRVYRELTHSTRYIRTPELYQELVRQPSKRFWVSEERAAVVLSSIFKGNMLHSMSKNKRKMFLEIFQRAKLLREQQPCLSIYEIAIKVVGQQAPEFYLTPESARVIICKSRKNASGRQ